jgi:hypothetical protein
MRGVVHEAHARRGREQGAKHLPPMATGAWRYPLGVGVLRRFEADLGLPKGLYGKLLDEDDWAFVIKIHALLEAAVTHLLTEELGRSELATIFSRLEMGDQTVGKLAFGKALGCLQEKDRAFARELGAIRNKYAHDIHHVGMTLKDYVSALNPDQFKNFRRAFGPGQDPFPIGERKVEEATFVRDNPKLCIWLAGLFVLAMAYQQKTMAAMRHSLTRQVIDDLAAYSAPK